MVDGEGGDVPFCVIAAELVEFGCVSSLGVVNCSFNEFTSFSAKVARCRDERIETYKLFEIITN